MATTRDTAPEPEPTPAPVEPAYDSYSVNGDPYTFVDDAELGPRLVTSSDEALLHNPGDDNGKRYQKTPVMPVKVTAVTPDGNADGPSTSVTLTLADGSTHTVAVA